MNNWIHLIIVLLCTCIGLSGLLKYLAYKKRMSLIGVLPVLFFGSFLFASIGFILNHFQIIEVKVQYIYVALSLQFGVSFMSFILLLIKDWSAKKIKTLLRLPIIVALVARYINAIEIIYLIFALEVLMIFLSFYMREKNLYVTRLQRKHLLIFPILIAMVLLKDINYLLIYLILTIGFKNAILNAMVIKNIIYKNEELEKNV